VNKIIKIFDYLLIITIVSLSGLSVVFGSEGSSLKLPMMDSLKTELPDSVIHITPDSLLFDEKNDKKSSSIDFPVYYHATDSNINMVQKQMLLLYGDAEVKYDDIQLNAAFIRVDMNNNVVEAYGMMDSVGGVIGSPIFVQGDETFNADTIRYNFKTRQGIIKDITTEFDGAFLYGGLTKRHSDETIHMINGMFTTCDLEHPHFYFKISKAKVIPNKKIVAGPSYLVLEDIPTPIGIPFGFFPNTKGATSGVIIPEYGEETNRGFFLRNGGYYLAINDYMDFLVTGDIYSKGSWGAAAKTNYKIKYKMSGALSFSYNSNVLGYKDIGSYSKSSLYKFKWIHKQDTKAHPSMSFNASVDMSSSAYDKYNTYSPQNYMSNTKQSSVNFSKFWPGTPFSFNMSLLHSQNSTDSTVTMTLPQMSFAMSRIYPLKRKNASGETRFYEKIGVSYTMSSSNRITAHEDSIFQSKFSDFSNGLKHSIPINTSFKVLKFLNISPYFNYTERWYLNESEKYWDTDAYDASDSTYGMLVTDEVPGFVRAWDYKVGASMTTKLYGMFEFNNKRLKALRHVLTPSISYNYYPDFSDSKYDFYQDYISDIRYNSYTGQYDTVRGVYSRFEGGIYGSPPSGGAGSIRFNLGNILEAKVVNPSDTTGEEKKIKLLESFSLNTNYNIMADSLNWAPITMTGRTTIGKLNLNFSASFDPYAYDVDTSGSALRINKSQFSRNGQLTRLTTAGITAGFRWSAGKSSENKNQDGFLYGYPDYYVDFSIPWNFNLNYSLNYAKPYQTSTITQTLSLSGDVSLTKKWKVSVSTGYDFINNDLTYTLVEIHRDLHCWEMSLSFVPIGDHQYYSFKLRVKSSILQDLKLQRRQTWWDNF
jgi:hypothetical protein